jgi:hypothetical protein
MDKVANFIRQGDGRFLLLKLAKVSHLYKNVGKTAEKVRNGEVRPRRASLPTCTLPTAGFIPVSVSLSLPAPSFPADLIPISCPSAVVYRGGCL